MGKRTVSDDKKVVVKSLVDSGMSYRKINEVTSVSLGLISKVVKEFEGNQELIEWYRENKAGVLAKAQLDNLALQNAIRESITVEALEKWTPDQKARWYSALGINFGIQFDKERLVLGESTENVSAIIKIIDEIKERDRRLESK
jgi:transposase